MNDERIRPLLEEADQAAGPPRYRAVRVGEIRRRYRRRRMARWSMLAGAAAVVLFGIMLWNPQPRRVEPAPEREDRIASLEEQVRQLQSQTEATLKLVQDVLARERQQQRLEALRAELASIPDPAVTFQEQADKTAFTLVYQADRMLRELNQTESAVEAYEQVIRLFPQNRWADVARERLSQIRKHQFNESPMEGESRCEPHESQPSA